MIRLRFVTSSDALSKCISWAEDFWASHVDAVLADGYLGAHADGGVALRPFDYDAKGLVREEFVALRVDPGTEVKWDAWLRSQIGKPYDFAAIFGIVVRAELGQRGHIICSGLQTQALIRCGQAPNFPMPPEEISPRDLRLFLAGKGVISNDQR